MKDFYPSKRIFPNRKGNFPKTSAAARVSLFQMMSDNKMGFLTYNAQTYTEVFGWRKAGSYLFLFTVFLPSYFMKRVKNILINVVRAA